MSNRIDALTGLRFFAALAIVFNHLNGTLWVPANGLPLNQGVSFFFVLSGFILQYSYRGRFENLSFSQFYLLRIARIWPSHLVIIVALVLHGASSYLSWGQILTVAFLLQSWSPHLTTTFLMNGPSWSLSVELFFYALFPILSIQALKRPERPLLIAALMTGLWLVFLTTLALYRPIDDFIAWPGNNPLARIFEFGLGVSAFEVCRRIPPHVWAIRKPIATMLEVVAIGVTLVAVVKSGLASAFVATHVSLAVGYWVGHCGSSLIFTLVIALFFRSEGYLSRFVGSKAVVYLGETSFAMYLIHVPMIWLFTALTKDRLAEFNMPSQIALFVLTLFVAMSALHFMVEKPCMALAKRLILRRNKQPHSNTIDPSNAAAAT
jgi:peptidoglycan/LPS O-acetylase OafA/YrhL